MERRRLLLVRGVSVVQSSFHGVVHQVGSERQYLAGNDLRTVGLCNCCLVVAVLHAEQIELALTAMREVLARDAMVRT